MNCQLKNCDRQLKSPPRVEVVLWGSLKRGFCCLDHAILFLADPPARDADWERATEIKHTDITA